MREAGLVIATDWCPAEPGWSTRLSTSFKSQVFGGLCRRWSVCSSSTVQAVPSLDGEGW